MVFQSNGSQADDAAAAAARESVQHAAAAPAASHIGVPMSPLSEVLWRGKGFMKPSNEGHNNTYGEVLGATAMLTWKDLCVTVVGGGQTILQSISGYAEPGSIMAIMGPSGSGKSTLLDVLAGRLSKNTVHSGEILLNGHRKNTLCYGTAAYVTQSDDLIATLTVHEYLHFSANLRLPSSISRAEKKVIVDTTMHEMGLHECANIHVGNWHLRGLSGGEKRRLSIALEILTRPRLLFLDEPTSGLDSASAFFVVSTLRNLARDGRTIMASVHQPSSEVFELFDDLTLLSGGQCMYFGKATDAPQECSDEYDHEQSMKLYVQHFAAAGFPCPALKNPSDHYLRAMNADFDLLKSTLHGSSTYTDLESSMDPLDRMTTKEVVGILAEVYQKSDYATAAMSRIQQAAETEGMVLKSIGSHASFFTQCWILTQRSLMNMNRDIGYYWLRSIIYILLSLCLGSVYWRVGFKYSSILGRAGCIAFIAGFLTFMSIGSFSSFVEDMKAFSRERMNGHYGVAVFVISNTLSSLPYIFLMALISGSIVYVMVQLHHGIEHYIYFILCLFAELACADSLMMAVATICPTFLVGILVGSCIQGIYMLVGGFFRLPKDLPRPVWHYPVSYLGFHMYGLQGMFKNDFLGLTFGSFILNGKAITPVIPGSYVVENMYGIQTSRGKWADLGILFGMILVYRLLFFICIKLNEDLQPRVRAYLMRYRTAKKINNK